MFFILYSLENEIRKNYIKTQKAESRKIDVLLNTIMSERKNEFNNFLNHHQDPHISSLMNSFSDLYSLDSTYTINKIYKKDPESLIFENYNFKNSNLYDFFRSIWTYTPSFSPLFQSPEKEGLSIYMAAKLDDHVYVGRIGIDKLNTSIISIAEYNESIIILATKDGYIVSSSKINLPFTVLPDYDQNEIKLDKTYFYTRYRSNTLSNDIVIMKPMSSVYQTIQAVKDTYPILVSFLLLIFFFKTLFQYTYIFKPLEQFIIWIRHWDSDSQQQNNSIRYKTKEINILQQEFSQKASQILLYIDQLQSSSAEMKRMKQYLKNIIDSMPSMLISINEQGIIQEWNEAAVKYYGVQATEAIGKNLWDILPYFQKYKEICQNSLDEKKSVDLKRELLKNGVEKYMNISIFPLVQNGVKDLAFRLDDITQLEKTEQILRQSQKMETIGSLAGGIAHDFNNILGGIVGTLSMLKLKSQKAETLESLKETCLTYAKTMEEASKRATEMVSHLLTLSRKQEPNLSCFDLNEALQHIEQICKNTFDKSIEMRFKPYPDECLINADINQIEQVLLNICINANHAMTFMRQANEPQGGILNVQINKIESDKHFVKNHPEAESDTTYWIVSISDTGVGMDSKLMSKIFDPFFTTKDKEKGTGLGLSMVYNIVKLHNGFIDVYSEFGHGTTFNVYLPVTETKMIFKKEDSESDIICGSGLILVIDDEFLIRQTYKDMLTECGYNVMLAEDGFQGVDLYIEHKNQISLVILDMAMPKKSGIETYKELKIINPDIKVLMASGFRQDERVIQSLQMGVNRFLQKPFTVNTLSQNIDIILKNK